MMCVWLGFGSGFLLAVTHEHWRCLCAIASEIRAQWCHAKANINLILYFYCCLRCKFYRAKFISSTAIKLILLWKYPDIVRNVKNQSIHIHRQNGVEFDKSISDAFHPTNSVLGIVHKQSVQKCLNAIHSITRNLPSAECLVVSKRHQPLIAYVYRIGR